MTTKKDFMTMVDDYASKAWRDLALRMFRAVERDLFPEGSDPTRLLMFEGIDQKVALLAIACLTEGLLIRTDGYLSGEWDWGEIVDVVRRELLRMSY